MSGGTFLSSGIRLEAGGRITLTGGGGGALSRLEEEVVELFVLGGVDVPASGVFLVGKTTF